MPEYSKQYKQEGIDCVHQKKDAVEAYSMCRNISPEVLDSFAKIILGYQPRKILEAGVGNGRLFMPILDKVDDSVEMVGVDISQNMLEELEQKIIGHGNTKLYRCDLKQMGAFDDPTFKGIGSGRIGDFDLVYTFATLHIIDDEKGWKTALENMAKALRPEGRLVLCEEINAVFHGSENLFEDEDYRISGYHYFPYRRRYELDYYQKVWEDIHIVTDFFQEYHRLREMEGLPFRRVNGQILHGDQSPAERYLRCEKGFKQSTISPDSLRWIKEHTLNEILYCIENATVTTLGSDMPTDLREYMCLRLERFCNKNGHKLDRILEIPSLIQLHIFEH